MIYAWLYGRDGGWVTAEDPNPCWKQSYGYIDVGEDGAMVRYALEAEWPDLLATRAGVSMALYTADELAACVEGCNLLVTVETGEHLVLVFMREMPDLLHFLREYLPVVRLCSHIEEGDRAKQRSKKGRE